MKNWSQSHFPLKTHHQSTKFGIKIDVKQDWLLERYFIEVKSKFRLQRVWKLIWWCNFDHKFTSKFLYWKRFMNQTTLVYNVWHPKRIMVCEQGNKATSQFQIQPIWLVARESFIQTSSSYETQLNVKQSVSTPLICIRITNFRNLLFWRIFATYVLGSSYCLWNIIYDFIISIILIFFFCLAQH